MISLEDTGLLDAEMNLVAEEKSGEMWFRNREDLELYELIVHFGEFHKRGQVLYHQIYLEVSSNRHADFSSP